MEYVAYVNNVRPHQGIAQAISATLTTKRPPTGGDGPISAVPLLGALHHVYCRGPEAAWHRADALRKEHGRSPLGGEGKAVIIPGGNGAYPYTRG